MNKVYKSCREYIITLCLCKNAETNEKRLDIINIKTAKYNGKNLLIYKIEHKITKQIIDKIEYKNELYIRGKIIKEYISYYKSKDCAFYHDELFLNEIKYNGEYKKYESGGQLILKALYKNGFPIIYIDYEIYTLNINNDDNNNIINIIKLFMIKIIYKPKYTIYIKSDYNNYDEIEKFLANDITNF